MGHASHGHRSAEIADVHDEVVGGRIGGITVIVALYELQALAVCPRAIAVHLEVESSQTAGKEGLGRVR